MKKFYESVPESELDFLLILEAGVNHDGNMEKALKLIDTAGKTEAQFIKFQTYTAEKIAAPHSPSYWDLDSEPTSSQIELFKKYDGFSVFDYEKLANEARSKGVGFLSTCFDTDWVEQIDHLLPFYKIASADLTNYPLIKAVARKHKPLLLSTGAASMIEISQSIKFIARHTDAPVCLMHCVLNYPTLPQNANLNRITELRNNFPGMTIGYSDHTQTPFSLEAISMAYALGARVFETHFTLNKTDRGNDHYHSLDLEDVVRLIENLKRATQMLAYNEEGFLSVQSEAREFARRGIYARRNLDAGHVIVEEDLIPLRPTLGVNGFTADEYENIIGKRVRKNLSAFEAILQNSIQ
jgi:N-acetylneuraminate synthase